MKKSTICLKVFFSLIYMTSCSLPVERSSLPLQHTDPFYNVNDDDYPLIHLPLIKPIEANRQDGRTPWGLLTPYGLFVSVPTRQDNFFYVYNVKELERISVRNDVIMAYSTYVDKEADAYIQDNYYHWFVLIPSKNIIEGFHTEDKFNEYIQTLGIQSPDWQTPDEAYKVFSETGCLEWIPDCSQ